jgi:hypothetical protein
MSHPKAFLFAALALAAATPVQAQITGGEDPSRRPTPVQEQTERTEAAPFRAGFYLRGGSMAATGDYGKLPSRVGTVYYAREAAEPVLSSGNAATNGYYGELGRLTYLGLPLPDMVRVGIDATLTAGYMNIDWDAVYRQGTKDQLGEAMMDARVGPAVSVMPLRGLRFDSSLKFGVGASGGPVIDVYDIPLQSGYTASVSDYPTEPAIGRSRSFTLSARLWGFTAGWEAHSLAVSRTREYSVYRSDGRSADFEYVSANNASTSRLFFGFSR